MGYIKQNTSALQQLNLCKRALTPQQYKTLRGQILAGGYRQRPARPEKTNGEESTR